MRSSLQSAELMLKGAVRSPVGFPADFCGMGGFSCRHWASPEGIPIAEDVFPRTSTLRLNGRYSQHRLQIR